jgi:cytochrome c oxidase cbb3-type subunit 1
MQAEAINRRLVKFIWAAAFFLAWTVIQGAIQGVVPSVSAITHSPVGGLLTGAHTHVGLMGWMTLSLMVAIYYVVPIISGKSIVWPKLIEWIFWLIVVGGTVASVLMIIGGSVAGNAFFAGVKEAQFEGIIMPYAMPAGILCAIAGIGALMFVVQVLVSLSQGTKAAS